MFSRTIAVINCCIFFGFAADAGISPGAPKMPFSFVENRGQFEPGVRYAGNGPEFKAWFEDRAVILQQGRTSVRIAFQTNIGPAGMRSVPSRIKIFAENPLAARVNYLRGTNQRQWKTDLPLFGSIHYTGIWPGVELTSRLRNPG